MKKVFIIHRWAGSPSKDWLPWLKKELVKRGFKVQVPAMPDPETPKIKSWVAKLKKVVGKPDTGTYFVGHSIGCQTILRYISKLSKGQKTGGAVFVGGWLTLKGLETEKEKMVATPWLKTPINFSAIKRHGGKYIAIFSDNDYYVPFKNRQLFRKKLGAKVITEHKKGHFTEDDKVKKLPGVLKSIIKISLV